MKPNSIALIDAHGVWGPHPYPKNGVVPSENPSIVISDYDFLPDTKALFYPMR
jgi:hypothetical protein